MSENIYDVLKTLLPIFPDFLLSLSHSFPHRINNWNGLKGNIQVIYLQEPENGTTDIKYRI